MGPSAFCLLGVVMPTPRKLRARAPIAIEPQYVSQLTSEQVVAIDARRYLELLAAHPEVPRAAVGKLRVVALEDLRSLLRSLASDSTGSDAVVVDTSAGDDDPPTTPDAVLARIGLTLRVGAPRKVEPEP